jgi:hypothetical protein
MRRAAYSPDRGKPSAPDGWNGVCTRSEAGQAASRSETGTLARAPASAPAAAGAPPTAQLGAALGTRSGGAAMPAATRAFFEPRFGVDLGHVRIHDGEQAAAMAQAIQARAFTHGRDIYFARGEFDPNSQSGRRLIAHELTHVAQQGRGEAQSVLQREDGPAQGGTEKDKPDPRVQEVNDALAAIEANWKEIRGVATFEDLAGWVSLGDSTLALLQTHTQAALAAMQSGDSVLFGFYLDLVESDKVMYDNIAWHVVYIANLLGIEGDMDRLIEAFNNDDRAFTDRDSAEELVNLLATLVEQFTITAHERLGSLTVAKSISVSRPGMADLNVTATTAYDADNRAILTTQTSYLIERQAELQTAITAVNKFMATAQKEGAWQAVEAVQEFFLVRGRTRGQGPQAQKNKGKKDKGQGKGGRWGCDDVRCNVYPDPQADPPNTSCPERVIGTSRGHSSFAAACLAAQQNANSKVPRGCIKRHCNCNSKCRKM